MCGDDLSYARCPVGSPSGRGSGRAIGRSYSEESGQYHEPSAQGNPTQPVALDADVCTTVLMAARIAPTAHTLLFVLAVLAIVPLATLLGHATEAVSEKTGDAVGGLLNATLGNLTELIIAVTALHAGEYMLVKASIAGAIVTNSLFMLGASFLLGGNSGTMFRSTIVRGQDALGVAVNGHDCAPRAGGGLRTRFGTRRGDGPEFQRRPGGTANRGIRIRPAILAQDSQGTFCERRPRRDEAKWPINLAVGTLLVVTVLVALVSEIFVES